MSIPELPSAELRAFDATVRAGSVSAGARLLGLRQPTVSAHIASIERAYNVQLFHRVGGRLELSEFGRTLHEATSQTRRGEEQAHELLVGARSGYEGVLRLGAIGPYNALPILAKFRKAHPRIRLRVFIGDSVTVLERVRAREDEIGMLLHAVDDPQIYCVGFRRQPLIVFAHRAHPLAAKPSILLQDLVNQEFVMREEGSQTRRVFEAALSAAGIKVRTSLEIGSREAVREAVAQGFGLGVVARTAFVPDERLTVLNVADIGLCTHVHAICLRDRVDLPLVRTVFGIVRELGEGE